MVIIACKNCKKEFKTYQSAVNRGKKYCSRKCQVEERLNTCEICGKKYKGHSTRSKFCSRECTAKSKMIAKTTLSCERCGSEFAAAWHEVNTGRKYCSKKCSEEARNNKISIVCDFCGKEFNVSPIYTERGARFCSFECRNASMHEEKFCKICGKKYIAPKRGRNADFCSKECLKLAKSKVRLRTCKWCGKNEYVQPYLAKRPFCSKVCAVAYNQRNNITTYCALCGTELSIANSTVKLKLPDAECYCSDCETAYKEVHRGHNIKSGVRPDIGRDFFRSSWEANYARYLNHCRVKWEFEKHVFQLSDGTKYIPDFYLIDEDRYVEIKGRWYDKAAKKHSLFAKEYPNISLTLIKEKEYMSIKRTHKNIIPNWE